MSFPSIGHYTQRPVSWLSLERPLPSMAPYWLKQRIEIGTYQVELPGGDQSDAISQPMGAVPLGYVQDLVILLYYETPEGSAVEIDDDDFYGAIEHGTTTDVVTLRDGSQWRAEPEEDAGGDWASIADGTFGSQVTTSLAQTQVADGQPTDGTGIQIWRMGQSAMSGARPFNIGGGGPSHWLRCVLTSGALGNNLENPHTFTCRYFVNRFMWQNPKNPFVVDPGRRRRYQIAQPNSAFKYRTERYRSRHFALVGNIDISNRVTQIKAGA